MNLTGSIFYDQDTTAEDYATNYATIYAPNTSYEVKFSNDGGYIKDNTGLKTEDGKHVQNQSKPVVYTYSDSGYCGTWKYDDGSDYKIVAGEYEHNYVKGVCVNCQAEEPVVYKTMGVTYKWDEEMKAYWVTDIADSEEDKILLENHGDDYVLRILEYYDDGENGRKQVIGVRYQAFNR